MDDQSGSRRRSLPEFRTRPRTGLPAARRGSDGEHAGGSGSAMLRRRYTVTVMPDGTEVLDDVEEWEVEP